MELIFLFSFNGLLVAALPGVVYNYTRVTRPQQTLISPPAEHCYIIHLLLIVQGHCQLMRGRVGVYISIVRTNYDECFEVSKTLQLSSSLICYNRLWHDQKVKKVVYPSKVVAMPIISLDLIRIGFTSSRKQHRVV